jgi:hypothetical protein
MGCGQFRTDTREVEELLDISKKKKPILHSLPKSFMSFKIAKLKDNFQRIENHTILNIPEQIWKIVFSFISKRERLILKYTNKKINLIMNSFKLYSPEFPLIYTWKVNKNLKNKKSASIIEIDLKSRKTKNILDLEYYEPHINGNINKNNLSAVSLATSKSANETEFYPQKCQSIFSKKKLFVTGLLYYKFGSTPKMTTEFNFQKGIFFRKANMLMIKYSHKLVIGKNEQVNYVYSIGGCTKYMNNPNEKDEFTQFGDNISFDLKLSECEKFSIQDNKWFQIPELNEPKCNVAACCFQKKYLFVFGGLLNNGLCSASIEKLDLQNEKLGWQFLSISLTNIPSQNQSSILAKKNLPPEPPKFAHTLKTSSKQSTNFHSKNSGMAQISKTEILIFGGESNSKKSKGCYLLDPTQHMISKEAYRLERKSSFFKNISHEYKKHIYIIDDDYEKSNLPEVLPQSSFLINSFSLIKTKWKQILIT